MRRRTPQSRSVQSSIWLIVAAVFIVGAIVTANNRPAPVSRAPASVSPENAVLAGRVVKVYDGDTIKLASGEKVRLIGIDTPELHDNPKLTRDVQKTGIDAVTLKQMGARSYEFTRGLLADRDVRLEFDKQPKDRYGRLLAYVYLEDGTFVNREIIGQGYAYPMAISPNTKHARDFKSLFEEARSQQRGLWGR